MELDARQAVEVPLVELHNFFAGHRFDIVTNTEFKVQLTPFDDRPTYSQSLPAPLNFKIDIFVELALPEKNGILLLITPQQIWKPNYLEKET